MGRTSARTPALALALVALVGGCRTGISLPDLGGLYDAAAQRHEPWRNPVVVIPGILGSRLVDEDGNVVWGAFSGTSADPGTRAGLAHLALPMAMGFPLDELRDQVVEDGALDRVHFSLFGLHLDVVAYAYILASLGVGGYRDEGLGLSGAVEYGGEHYTCFQFAYDWRRDLPENAARLGEFLREKEAYVRATNAELYGSDPQTPVRFDVVAHSMGGLVLRWFLRYGDAAPDTDGNLPELDWAGAPLVERAILVGTPNLGSLDALGELVDGFDPGTWLPRYPPALLGTYPSVYQLLPRARHGALLDQDGQPVADLHDPRLWVRNGWGLADPDQARQLEWMLPELDSAEERRRVALDHQRKCLERARAVSAALDRPARTPPGTELFLVAGDATPTRAVVKLDERLEPFDQAHAPGDGTVLRASALGDERMGRDPSAADWPPRLESPIDWHQVLFLFSDHLGLTRDPSFTDNVLFLLLEDPRTHELEESQP